MSNKASGAQNRKRKAKQNADLRRIQTESSRSLKYVHYLGKNIQNELINLLGTHNQSIILADAKRAKYFSMILDGIMLVMVMVIRSC